MIVYSANENYKNNRANDIVSICMENVGETTSTTVTETVSTLLKESARPTLDNLSSENKQFLLQLGFKLKKY